MIFNSFEFAIFFIIVTTLYFLFSHRHRWWLLLISSCYFYMAFVPVYITILGFTLVIDYIAGMYIGKSEGKRRKLYFFMSLLANIGILVVFKYYNFFIENMNAFAGAAGYDASLSPLNMLLPIGLSFHTFQAMSYTFEVYRGNYQPERHFGIYALYVMFYPQLVAGPIERPQNILHQFKRVHQFDYQRVVSGLQLMAWGLFKKVVIADRLSVLVDRVYEHPREYNSCGLILATFFFCYQIFCDFSGYTDIARGAARVMGFSLVKNFNRPYNAKSVADFWSRWHISLSTWFRDYLYIPLGGNRVAIPRWYLNLFIVFMVSGLWHGANWTFIVWGALHGVYLVSGLITRRFRDKVSSRLPIANSNGIKVITTFTLVAFAWIFFRANNIHDAAYVAKQVITGIPNAVRHFRDTFNYDYGMPLTEIMACFGLIAFLEFIQSVQKHKDIPGWLQTVPRPVRWSIYLTLILAILSYGVFTDKQFIYFQF